MKTDESVPHQLLQTATTRLVTLRRQSVWNLELPPRCPPILWFGNAESAKPKLVTVGANPSRQEYLADSSQQALEKVQQTGDHSQLDYLEPPDNRFYLLPEGERPVSILMDEDRQQEIIDGYNQYFTRNPYRWFGKPKAGSYNTEGFLRGLGASYFDDAPTDYQAIHIDLFPLATLSDFKRIQQLAEDTLFTNNWAQSLVRELIDYLDPVILVVFGQTNVNYFGQYIDHSILALPSERFERSTYIYGQSTLGRQIVGLSTNLGNPIGFSATTLREYGEHVRQVLQDGYQ